MQKFDSFMLVSVFMIITTVMRLASAQTYQDWL